MSDKNKRTTTVISKEEEADLSGAKLSEKLSAVDFDEDGKFFYMTLDRAVFTDPVTTIQTVLDAHGFVPNLENILSCLDSFRFSVHTKLTQPNDSAIAKAKVGDYLPCLSFELPRKNRIGPILKSFYDEVSRHDTKSDEEEHSKNKANEKQTIRRLKEKNEKLEKENHELQKQVQELTRQLSIEQRSLSRASKAMDSQQVLPANAHIGRIQSIDLKRRTAKVKCRRRVFDIPTHILDRVPDYQARCLITFDEDDDQPVGIIFFSNTELADVEKRTAELLHVDGKRFKARDSKRTEFQIKAVNDKEAATIASLSRGDQVVISISDGYVVRFSALEAETNIKFCNQVAEQFLLYDISRNPLVARAANDAQAG